MTVRLPEDLGYFVQNAVARGRFASADEAVAEAVRLLRDRERTATTSGGHPATEEEFRRHLVRIGLMSEVPAGDEDPDEEDDEPIAIDGEPLSETIIRERR